MLLTLKLLNIILENSPAMRDQAMADWAAIIAAIIAFAVFAACVAGFFTAVYLLLV